MQGSMAATESRWAAALGLAALIAALVAAPTAAAAQVVKLVSNTGQSSEGAGTSNLATDYNQNFYFFHGANPTGYMLTAVDIEFKVGNPSGTTEPTYTVTVHPDPVGPQQPSIGTLTGPSRLQTGLNRFTAPGDGIYLPRGNLPHYGYGVTIDVSDAGDRNVQVVHTYSNAEDAGSAVGLTVGNGAHVRDNGLQGTGGWWYTGTGGWSLKIAVYGYPYAPGMPGKVPAPAVNAGTASGSLAVSWNTFPTDTDYDLRYYAGDADPADPADWIEEGETGGHTHTGAATTATITGLAEGTAYRVQVRAGNPHGKGPWSDSGSATTAVTNRAPRLLQLGSSDGCEEKTPGTAFTTPNFPSNTLISISPLTGRDQCSGSDRKAPMFEDPDGDALTYSTSYTLPANVHFFDGIPGIAAPGSTQGGTQGRVFFRGVTAREATDIRVDVTATDPHGATATTHIVLKGKPPPNTGAPQFVETVNLKNTLLNRPVRWLLPAASGGDTTYTDADGDTITVPYDYAMSGLPAGVVFDAATRRVTGTPTTLGSYQVTYTADDADGAWSRKASPSAADTADAARQTITLNVAEVIGAAATGAPTISGLARAGETLTASTDGIADADGLSG
ncbi:MAG: fibronectin type III domain-containing protein, partial [bacterium]|nr:fibronectin type III domain-containing protein [bacterium]